MMLLSLHAALIVIAWKRAAGALFKMSYCAFMDKKKVVQLSNNMIMNKWQNFHFFEVHYSFKFAVIAAGGYLSGVLRVPGQII